MPENHPPMIQSRTSQPSSGRVNRGRPTPTPPSTPEESSSQTPQTTGKRGRPVGQPTVKQKLVAFLKEKEEKFSERTTLNKLTEKFGVKYPDFFRSLDLEPGIPNNLQDGEGLPESFNSEYDDYQEKEEKGKGKEKVETEVDDDQEEVDDDYQEDFFEEDIEYQGISYRLMKAEEEIQKLKKLVKSILLSLL